MAKHHLVFWNVENLFDVEDAPGRSDKLNRTLGNELKGWAQDVLDAKIRQLASILRQVNCGHGPDVLGVCEVENRHVLELLRDAITPLDRQYDIAHEDAKDRRGVDVAFLYDADRYEIRDKEIFSHFVVRRSATRDLVQVNLRTKPGGRLLVVIGNHWPARSAGQLESAPYRAIAAETLSYFHDRIRDIHGKDVAVVAMGDFNDEPFDRSLTDYALSESQAQKVRSAHSPRMLNLMWPALGAAVGTQYHNNQAHVLDQFLISKGLLTGKSGLRALPGTAEVLRFPEMVSRGSYPKPRRFGRGKKPDLEGYSDHFPIGVTIEEKE
jgi:endonuclease/exonuclease/phosphatase family metal-dependent hydrolase